MLAVSNHPQRIELLTARHGRPLLPPWTFAVFASATLMLSLRYLHPFPALALQHASQPTLERLVQTP